MPTAVCSFDNCFLPSVILASLFGILLLFVIFAMFKYQQLTRILTALNHAWHNDGTCYGMTQVDRCKLYWDDTLGDLPQAIMPTEFNAFLARRAVDYVARIETLKNYVETPPNHTQTKLFMPTDGPAFGVAWMNGTTLVLCFRCTFTQTEVQDDLNAHQVQFDSGVRISAPLSSVPSVSGLVPAVHSGFYEVSHRFLPEIVETMSMTKPKLVFLCGHSLGAATVILLSTILAQAYPSTKFVSYCFGTPRVGNGKFHDRVTSLPNLSIWRVVNYYDQIQDLPWPVTPNFQKPFDLPFYYEHAGNQYMYYDNRGSWRTNHSLANYISHLHALYLDTAITKV